MQKKNKNFHIYGNGFKAIYLALSLNKKYPSSSISISLSKNFFGAYDYKISDNFYLDYGCHLFSNNKKFKELFELKQSDIYPINLNYASVNNYGITNGYSIYDLRNHSDIKHIIADFEKNFFKKKNNPINLEKYYTNIYGKKITSIINNICFKFTGLPLNKLSNHSNEFLFFNRILIYNTKKSLNLKKGFIEPILATPFKYNYDLSEGYISFAFKKGNYGFVKKVNSLFKKYNIKFTSTPQPSSEIIDLRPSNLSYEKKMKINVPLHLIYFLTDRYKYTYLHDYSDNPIFRISSPGFYTYQKDKSNKYSYVCIEIPDPKKKYNKNDLIDISKKYLNKKKIRLLDYIFMEYSYPSIYKKNYDISNYSIINPTLYSKDKIMQVIDRYLINV